MCRLLSNESGRKRVYDCALKNGCGRYMSTQRWISSDNGLDMVWENMSMLWLTGIGGRGVYTIQTYFRERIFRNSGS